MPKFKGSLKQDKQFRLLFLVLLAVLVARNGYWMFCGTERFPPTTLGLIYELLGDSPFRFAFLPAYTIAALIGIACLLRR